MNNLNEAQRISKYWTDTTSEDQHNLAKKKCLRQRDYVGLNVLQSPDNSSIVFWEASKSYGIYENLVLGSSQAS